MYVGEAKAKARAVPRKGAEQGVERIVAKIPFKKSPKWPDAFISPNDDPPGVLNSNSPKRLRAKINIMITIIATK